METLNRDQRGGWTPSSRRRFADVSFIATLSTDASGAVVSPVDDAASAAASDDAAPADDSRAPTAPLRGVAEGTVPLVVGAAFDAAVLSAEAAPPHRRSGENSTAGRRRCCRFGRRCRARGRCGRFRHTLRRHIGEDTGAGHRFSRRCCCSKCHCRRRRLLRSLQQRTSTSPHFPTEITPEQPRHHRQKSSR